MIIAAMTISPKNNANSFNSTVPSILSKGLIEASPLRGSLVQAHTSVSLKLQKGGGEKFRMLSAMRRTA